MWTREFWLAVTERAIKTAGQFGAGALGTFILTDVEQIIPVGRGIGLAMLTGLVLSVLTSLASAPMSGDGPSLGPELLAGHREEEGRGA